jgi:hypothetical protein
MIITAEGPKSNPAGQSRGRDSRHAHDLRRDLAVSCREHIEASPELTDSERAAVLGATAKTLLPQLEYASNNQALSRRIPRFIHFDDLTIQVKAN